MEQGAELVDGMAEQEIDTFIHRHQRCRSEREDRKELTPRAT
jgi:hypothetical protein